MKKLQTIVNTATQSEVEIWFIEGEFVCKLFTRTQMTRNHQRKADYFTDYQTDALGTAHAMLGLKPAPKG